MRRAGLEVRALVRAERSDFADLLDELTPAQWATSSLCSGWTVRDVVAHVTTIDRLSWAEMAGHIRAGSISLAQLNDAALHTIDHVTEDELVHRMREPPAHHGPGRVLDGAVMLTDALIHHQDIRRPLGRPRDISPARLVAALAVATRTPTLPGWRLARRVRLRATDLDWTWGRGPDVEGPAEALLMVLAGRNAAAESCVGQGLASLPRRACA